MEETAEVELPTERAQQQEELMQPEAVAPAGYTQVGPRQVGQEEPTRAEVPSVQGEVHISPVGSTQAEAEGQRREVEQTLAEEDTPAEVLIQGAEPTLEVVVRPGEVQMPEEELTLAEVLIQGEELTPAVVVRLGEAQILEEELKLAVEISVEASTQEENILAVG